METQNIFFWQYCLANITTGKYVSLIRDIVQNSIFFDVNLGQTGKKTSNGEMSQSLLKRKNFDAFVIVSECMSVSVSVNKGKYCLT